MLIGLSAGLFAWAGAGCSRSTTPAASGPGGSKSVVWVSYLEQQLMAAAVDSIAAEWKDSTSLCIEIGDSAAVPGAPSDGLLRALRTRQKPVRAAECPPTYTHMISIVDSLGRPLNPAPPGYVDPHILTVSRPRFEDDSAGWVHVVARQGTRGDVYKCATQYLRGRAVAVCRLIRSKMS